MQVGKQTESVGVKVRQKPIEEVTGFSYVGNLMTSNRDAETNVNFRIGKAVATVFRR